MIQSLTPVMLRQTSNQMYTLHMIHLTFDLDTVSQHLSDQSDLFLHHQVYRHITDNVRCSEMVSCGSTTT